jgi:hypothetical protein
MACAGATLLGGDPGDGTAESTFGALRELVLSEAVEYRSE